MRISSAMYYNTMSNSSMSITSELQKISEQLSTGKKLNVSSDDPVAYAQASNLSQQISLKSNALDAWGTIEDRTKAVETNITSSIESVSQLREWILNAKNTTKWLTASSLDANTVINLKSELLNLANAKTATGDYMYSGFQNTAPFIQTAAGVSYSGDQGTRVIPAGSDVIPVEPSGDNVFMYKPSSSITVSNNTNWFGGNNLGNATISVDSSSNIGSNLNVVFSVDRTVTPPVNKLDVLDSSGTSIVNGMNRMSGTPQAALPLNIPSNGSVDISSYLGQTPNTTVVRISSQPEDGDQYNLTNSTKQNIFDVFDNVLSAISGTYTSTTSISHNQLQNNPVSTPSTVGTQGWSSILDKALNDIDAWTKTAQSVQSSMGATQTRANNETSSLGTIKNMYTSQLSKLEDLDYASTLMKQAQLNTQLQALYKTFSSSEGMSLFKYLA